MAKRWRERDTVLRLIDRPQDAIEPGSGMGHMGLAVEQQKHKLLPVPIGRKVNGDVVMRRTTRREAWEAKETAGTLTNIKQAERKAEHLHVYVIEHTVRTVTVSAHKEITVTFPTNREFLDFLASGNAVNISGVLTWNGYPYTVTEEVKKFKARLSNTEERHRLQSFCDGAEIPDAVPDGGVSLAFLSEMKQRKKQTFDKAKDAKRLKRMLNCNDAAWDTAW